MTERQAQAAAPLEQAEARLLAEIDRMLAESRQSGIQHATLDSALGFFAIVHHGHDNAVGTRIQRLGAGVG